MSAESETSVARQRGSARGGQSRLRRLGRGVLIGLTVALCIVIVLAGVGVFYVQQTLPQTSGSPS